MPVVNAVFDSHLRPLHRQGAAVIFGTPSRIARYLCTLFVVDPSQSHDHSIGWQAELLSQFSATLFLPRTTEERQELLEGWLLQHSLELLTRNIGEAAPSAEPPGRRVSPAERRGPASVSPSRIRLRRTQEQQSQLSAQEMHDREFAELLHAQQLQEQHDAEELRRTEEQRRHLNAASRRPRANSNIESDRAFAQRLHEMYRSESGPY